MTPLLPEPGQGKLTIREAVGMLPDKPSLRVHRQDGYEDWDRDRVIEAIVMHGAERSGTMATKCGYGLAVKTGSGWIWIEAKY